MNPFEPDPDELSEKDKSKLRVWIPVVLMFFSAIFNYYRVETEEPLFSDALFWATLMTGWTYFLVMIGIAAGFAAMYGSEPGERIGPMALAGAICVVALNLLCGLADQPCFPVEFLTGWIESGGQYE